MFARWNFSGRSKLAAQLILLHFIMNLPKKVSLVSAYTFYMYEAMDIACNDCKDDTNVGKNSKDWCSKRRPGCVAVPLIPKQSSGCDM